MLMGQSQVDRQKYYLETMNLSLLSHAKIMSNVLMRKQGWLMMRQENL